MRYFCTPNIDLVLKTSKYASNSRCMQNERCSFWIRIIYYTHKQHSIIIIAKLMATVLYVYALGICIYDSYNVYHVRILHSRLIAYYRAVKLTHPLTRQRDFKKKLNTTKILT